MHSRRRWKTGSVRKVCKYAWLLTKYIGFKIHKVQTSKNTCLTVFELKVLITALIITRSIRKSSTTVVNEFRWSSLQEFQVWWLLRNQSKWYWVSCMPVCQVSSVMSNSLRPHGLQPARLLCPWDSAGKNTGVGCHALLQRANLLHPGIKLFPALAGGFFTTSATCCSQIKTQWEREGRGSGSAVLPRGQSRMLEEYLCGGLRRGGGGEAVVEGRWWWPSQPRLEKAAVQQKAHLAATQDENQGGRSCGAHEMGICSCIEIAALLFILKKQNLYFQVTINFQKSFISKHYPSNPPFLSAFRVRRKLICVFNFKEKKKKKVSLWLGNSRHGFSLPFFPSHSLSRPSYTSEGPSVGGPRESC